MQGFYDYKKFAILYVDDEEKSLKYFAREFGEHFRILTASSAEEGFKVFQQHQDEIAILMTDQRMPGEQGVQLLEKVRHLRPRTLRILATAYSDYEAAVAAVNTGAIYKYVSKPWHPPELEITLRRALEFFMVQTERDQLLREKLSVLQNMMITDRVISLGVLAAGMSHHIRNSLVAVRTFLDLAPAKLREENIQLDELRNPNYWREFYDHVQSQVKRIMEMLADVGAVSEKPKPVFKDKVQLSEVIVGSVAKLNLELAVKKIRVENNVSSSLPSLTVDETKFNRIFELLLKDETINLPENSVVTISASMLPTAMLQIEVVDDGPGLPDDDLRSVFNPFFLRKDDPQEFGINLMTCYFLVYHHGGTIEVKNGAAKGTVFTLNFPVTPLEEVPNQEDRQFVAKVLTNEALWEKLLSGD
ncbi:MAG: Response regulator receiver domain protein [Verrucomicrobiales bacterium]|nr:Response regulator receiver domain protein [Verrucomicrobiales bacterium]